MLVALSLILVLLTNESDFHLKHSRMILSGDIHPNPGPASNSDTLSNNSSPISISNTSQINSNLSFIHYNVQSLLPKIDVLGIELRDFDLLAFSETWLSDEVSSDDLIITSFKKPERKDRNDGYGGVTVYVKNTIQYKRRLDLELNDIECIWLELSVVKKKILFSIMYRPPNSSANYLNSLNDSINLAYDTGIKDIIITGDFNLNVLHAPSQRKINTLCQQYGLTQIIEEMTHYTEHSSSIIDLIFVNDVENVVLSGVGDPFLDQNQRFHCPIFCFLKHKKPKIKSFTRNVWLFDKANFDLMRQNALTTDWTDTYDDNTDTYCSNITDKIKLLAHQCIPNRKVTIKPSDPPWITTKIKCSIRKRKRLYKNAKIRNTPHDWAIFKRCRNDTVSLVRNAKTDYLNSISSKLLSDKFCSQNWWKTLKKMISPNVKSPIPTLQYNDKCASEDNDKADLLNAFFTAQTNLNEGDAVVPALPNSIPCISSITVTVDEVKSVLGCLPLGKASGPDDINNRVLRELANELSAPLTSLFNKSLTEGYFPSSWKEANVSAIFKKGDPSQVNNYRPISLLSNIEKVLERIVFKRIYNFLLGQNFLSPFQSGFIPGDSPVNQLAFIYNSFCKAIDEGKEIRAVFFDISKAFDRVWHKGLLAKLKSAGVTGNLLHWFSSYLTNRRQRVILPGTSSDWSAINAGVPQGSILGPLLFLVYINDIVSEIHCNIRLFADDTSLYLTVDHPDSAAQHLNSDIQKIIKWADTWLVSFNPSKTESFVVSRKQAKPFHPPLIMTNEQITTVKSHKHLGVVLSDDCGWHSHIDYIKEKAWKRINIMRNLKFTLDRKSLEIIYISFIRPILEYADVIWGNCLKGDKDELEKIQSEAARIVTGASKLISLRNLYREIGWEPLETRRNNHKLVLFYKMYKGTAPSYLNSLVPPLVGEVSLYSLRNSENVTNIPSRTNLYNESFLPSTITLWNSLPVEIRNSPSLSSFKQAISKSAPPKPPPHYLVGQRRAQIYHTRLRTNCSSLNLTLFQKNLIDAPLCQCGEIESTEHFFFQCPFYQQLRTSLLNKINPTLRASTHLFLFGNEVLSNEENENLFLAVQEYITKSKRFY
jgi:hypothetical protein